MDVGVNYASLLEGKLMFGDPYSCPEHADIIVSTLSDYDKKYEFKVDETKLRKFPMRPGFEPEYLNLFEALLIELDKELRQGKSVYIFDPDGTERATLVAWRLLVKNLRCQYKCGLDLINEAYQKRTNRLLELVNITIPRFYRQTYLGILHSKGGYIRFNKRKFSKLRRKFGKDGSSNKNKTNGIKGRVRTGSLISKEESNQFCDPILKGYTTIRLIRTAISHWAGLSSRFLGPIELTFVTKYGSVLLEKSYSLNNAFFSLWVFDDHLDWSAENPTVHSEKPNVKFFTEHAQMVGALKTLKKHPMYMRKTPYHPGHLPRYIYWQGELIPFRYGKVYIYSALYRYLVSKTRVYRDLVNTMESGANLFILDYDAVDFFELGMTYDSFIDDEEQPWTDAHILYGMLTNETSWLIEDILNGVILSKT